MTYPRVGSCCCGDPYCSCVSCFGDVAPCCFRVKIEGVTNGGTIDDCCDCDRLNDTWYLEQGKAGQIVGGTYTSDCVWYGHVCDLEAPIRICDTTAAVVGMALFWERVGSFPGPYDYKIVVVLLDDYSTPSVIARWEKDYGSLDPTADPDERIKCPNLRNEILTLDSESSGCNMPTTIKVSAENDPHATCPGHQAFTNGSICAQVTNATYPDLPSNFFQSLAPHHLEITISGVADDDCEDCESYLNTSFVLHDHGTIGGTSTWSWSAPDLANPENWTLCGEPSGCGPGDTDMCLNHMDFKLTFSGSDVVGTFRAGIKDTGGTFTPYAVYTKTLCSACAPDFDCLNTNGTGAAWTGFSYADQSEARDKCDWSASSITVAPRTGRIECQEPINVPCVTCKCESEPDMQVTIGDYWTEFDPDDCDADGVCAGFTGTFILSNISGAGTCEWQYENPDYTGDKCHPRWINMVLVPLGPGVKVVIEIQIGTSSSRTVTWEETVTGDSLLDCDNLDSTEIDFCKQVFPDSNPTCMWDSDTTDGGVCRTSTRQSIHVQTAP